MFVTRGPRGAVLATCALLLLATSACGTNQAEEADARQVRLYGTDGNMQNSFAAEFEERANLLDGMRGTTPLTPLSDDFKNRLRTVNPKLTDYLYAAESYDAVMVSVLAAQLAGTTTPT